MKLKRKVEFHLTLKVAVHSTDDFPSPKPFTIIVPRIFLQESYSVREFRHRIGDNNVLFLNPLKTRITL